MTQQYTDLELMSWRPAKNVGSATINAREVCKVCTGGDSLDRSIVAVKQPDADEGKTYCVNGPTPIAVGAYGRVCFGPVVLVAYDTGTPAIDDQYGWKSGQGTVVKDEGVLFNVLRVVNSTSKLLLGSIIGGESATRRFELKDAHAPSGTTPNTTSATAYVCDEDWVADTSDEFEVYDPLNRFRGRARGAMSSPNDKGSQGEARLCSNGHWEIVWMQPHALRINALVNEASGVATTDSTFAIDAIEVMQPTGGLLMSDLTSGDGAYNVFGWKIDNDTRVDLAWNEADAHWDVVQAKCPA